MNNQENQPMVRTVASTQSEMTEIVLPNDTNVLGNLLGGRLMHFIDLTGALAAYRHTRSHAVTAAMDHIDFIHPVRLGDLVMLKSSVNRAFTTSMEVGVKVWAENYAHWRRDPRGQRLPCVCGCGRARALAKGSASDAGDAGRGAALWRRAAPARAPRARARAAKRCKARRRAGRYPKETLTITTFDL